MPLEIAQALSASRLTEIRAQLSSLLPTTRPITLEIGSGHGHYLTAYAAAHPDHLCIGIDLIGDRLERSARKSNRAKLTNIIWMHADARLFVEALPADTALSDTFVLFSDPWPKRRHWKNRVIQPEFLSLLARKTGQGARLYFRTDHDHYFNQVKALIKEHSDWNLDIDAPWPFELPTVFQQRAESHQSLIARKT
jgi:tRNA (guanine-N7-)-methyltransferase